MTKEKLNAFFITEEQLGERKINVLRLAFLAVFLLNEFSNYYVLKVVAGWLHERAVATMLAWLAYAAGAWYFVNKRRLYDRPVKYISAAADALFLTLTIVLVEGNNGPLVPVYYILIVGCALRYSYRAILAAAGIASLRIIECSPQEVKLSVTGYGNADKKAIATMLPRLIALPEKKRLDDELDAIAVGIAALAMNPS